ncbi:MAG: polysaccharide transporter, family [Caulobacteraceae bacterium]|nr:polysaccharide transporter, family [Caulobacteraceae bacterium]
MSERRAFFGTVALAGAQVARLGLQFAVLPVLARILGPSAYGLVALAMPFILLANMVADAGLGNALVRVQNPSRALESTVFWLSVAVCVGLTLAIWALAWPASRLLSAPRLPPILMALSALLVVSGSLSVANARIMRERRFAVFAASDATASAVSAFCAIGAALLGCGAWSLVVQQLVLWLIKAVWVSAAAGFRPDFVCRPSLAKPYLSFGLNAAASNVADFVSKNAPTVIVGGLLGVLAVGHYSMAFQLTRLPDSFISGPIYLAIFTAGARVGDDHGRAVVLASRGLRGVATAMAPIFGGLAMVADLAIKLLLGAKWAPAAPILALLAPAGFLLCFYSIISAVLMGLGRAEWQLRLTVLSGATMGLGTLIGVRHGPAGVAVGLSIGAILVGPAYLWVLARQLDMSVRRLAGEFAAPLLATLAMMLAVAVARLRLGHWSDWGQLLGAVAIGVASFALALALLSGRRLLEDIRGLLPSRILAQPELS